VGCRGVKRTIRPDSEVGQVGNFNLATTNEDLVFTAGQVPQTDEGEVLNDAPVEKQTHQCLENISAVLANEGLTLEDILKTTVYIVDIQNWERVNEAYAQHFEEYPARTAVGVTGLWGGVDIEIQAIAAADD